MWIIVGLILVGLLFLFVADKVGLPMGKGTGYQMHKQEDPAGPAAKETPIGQPARPPGERTQGSKDEEEDEEEKDPEPLEPDEDPGEDQPPPQTQKGTLGTIISKIWEKIFGK